MKEKLSIHSLPLIVFLWLYLSISSFAQYPSGSPVSINGKLQVVGGKLRNECGNPVQLRGVSTHGVQWYGNCINSSSLNALTTDWKIDVLRIAMYIQEGGYVNNPSYWKGWIDNIVNECEKRGIYAVIDFHVHIPGDPMEYINEAREFWNYMSLKHAGKKHVLYEICNEPNQVSWSRVKQYANDIIPRIRANDSQTVIIVGSSTWSQDVDEVADSPLNYPNLAYSLHFYAGTHKQALRDKADYAISKGIALMVTEFGTSDVNGANPPNIEAMDIWMEWMGKNNISWMNWSFADKAESSAALNPGACGGNWNNTSASGTYIKKKLSDPEDKFVCNGDTSTPLPEQIAYEDTPWAVPGKIEAENYDKGGSLVAFKDNTKGNIKGQYRNEDVDIETSTDVGGGFNLAGIESGEWTEYTIDVKENGDYNLNLRVASTSRDKTIQVLIDNLDISGSVTIPRTGGWQVWRTVTVSNIKLTKGVKVLKLLMETNGFNINYFEINPANVTANVPPRSSITSPLQGATFNDPASLTINATASDSDGTVSKVEFYNGATKLGEDLTSPYSYSISNPPAGTYNLSVTAIDNRGASTKSASREVTVIRTSQTIIEPTVSITSPSNNATFSEPSTLTINASAADADGSVSKVEFYNNSQKIGEDLTSPFSVTINTPAVGAYVLTATATDNDGNTKKSSTVNVTVTKKDNCDTEAIPAANSWVVSNDWGDQYNGSKTSNTTSEMKITHRPWGRNKLWVVQSGKTRNIKSNTKYTVSFDFKNDANNPVTSLEVGFASGFGSSGPSLSQPTVMATGGLSSSDYTKKSVEITSTSNGSVYLLIAQNWPGQPNQEVNTMIKNLSFCTPSTASAREASINEANVIYQMSPNPFQDFTTININSDENLPVNIMVSDMTGRTVYYSSEFYTNQNFKIGEDLNNGMYVLKAYFGEKSVSFLINKNN